MKKTYIIPETCSINLETAEVLAGSANSKAKSAAGVLRIGRTKPFGRNS